MPFDTLAFKTALIFCIKDSGVSKVAFRANLMNLNLMNLSFKIQTLLRIFMKVFVGFFESHVRVGNICGSAMTIKKMFNLNRRLPRAERLGNS